MGQVPSNEAPARRGHGAAGSGPARARGRAGAGGRASVRACQCPGRYRIVRVCRVGGCALHCKNARREDGSAAATDAAMAKEREWQSGGRERWQHTMGECEQHMTERRVWSVFIPLLRRGVLKMAVRDETWDLEWIWSGRSAPDVHSRSRFSVSWDLERTVRSRILERNRGIWLEIPHFPRGADRPPPGSGI